MPTPDPEMVQAPTPEGAQRVSYLDAGGQPTTSREAARFALVRDFDDEGNVISLITERLPQ